MIKRVHECFVGNEADPRDCLLYWTYLICLTTVRHKTRFDLLRISNTTDKMERLGCELSIKECRKIIKQHEPTYKPSYYVKAK